MSDKPKTVTVKALQPHTSFGQAYSVGDEYEIDEAFVDSVEAQGKAVRVASPAAKPAAKSHPVEPMTTEDFGGKPKSKK